jgi:hypothetical protein
MCADAFNGQIALLTLLMVVQWQWYGQSVILLH